MKNAVKNIWREIRISHIDEETGVTYVDGYLTDDENEQGKVIATIDDKGNPTYLDERAKEDKYAQNEILEAMQRIEHERRKLIDKVIEELKKDFASGDYTVIDEILIHHVPTTALIGTLPEDI